MRPDGAACLREPEERSSSRSSRIWSWAGADGGLRRLGVALAFLLPFLLYAATTCRSVAPGDSAELAAGAACFGVPHPPGYPLYTLSTALWLRLFPQAMWAHAANLASALHGALAVCLSLLLFLRLGAGWPGAALGAVMLALGRTFWGQATVAEVYAFDLLLLALAGHALTSALAEDRRSTAAIAGLAVALWISHRPVNLVYLPSLLLATSRVRRVHWGRTTLAAAAAGGSMAALVLLYLPLASLRGPGVDVGDPETWRRFWAVITCSPYARHAGGGLELAWGRLLGLLRDLPAEAGVGLIAAALALLPSPRRRGGERRTAVGLAFLLATGLAVTCRYNVLDARVFLLPGLWALAALAALGLGRVRSRVAVGLLAAGALALLPLNLAVNDRHGDRTTERYARDLLRSAPAEAVLFVFGDTAAHSLWYAQEVERARPDVLVISLGHSSEWYFEQLRARHPSLPWPALAGRSAIPSSLPVLLPALAEVRPITFASDPAAFVPLGPAEWWGTRTVIPRGLLLEVLPKRPAPDRAALAEASIGLWTKVRAEGGGSGRDHDLETSLIRLHYATAFLRCGEFLARQGRADAAAELFRATLAADTERLEREVETAYLGIGQRRPPLRLAEHAARALAELEPRGKR